MPVADYLNVREVLPDGMLEGYCYLQVCNMMNFTHLKVF